MARNKGRIVIKLKDGGIQTTAVFGLSEEQAYNSLLASAVELLEKMNGGKPLLEINGQAVKHGQPIIVGGENAYKDFETGVST